MRHGGGQVATLEVDLTAVSYAGRWLTVGVGMDAVLGTVLRLDLLPNGQAATTTARVQEVARVLGAVILVNDDAAGVKIAADASGRDQPVGKAHVLPHTEAGVEAISPGLSNAANESLALVAVSPAQAVVDSWELLRLMTERQLTPAVCATLATIHRRSLGAAKPALGEARSLAYHLRLFSLDRRNLWGRLTRYRAWKRQDGECLDGTNNGGERAIGWGVKERYRSMGACTRPASVLHVSRLLATMGIAGDGPSFPLAEVTAECSRGTGAARPASPHYYALNRHRAANN